MLVAQDRPTDVEHKWPMAFNQGSEGELSCFTMTAGKPLQELAVSKRADRPEVEQNTEMLPDRAIIFDCHVSFPKSVVPLPANKRHEGARRFRLFFAAHKKQRPHSN